MHPVSAVPGAAEIATWWTWDPLVIGGLLVSSAVYTCGVARLWRHAGPGRGVKPWQAAAHGAGIAVIAVALLSPLDHASDVLFSAHMAQHELLMLVAAPLIVLGRPLVPAVWALPHDWRVRARRIGRSAPVAGAWRVLTLPAVALLVHAATRWAWHIPSAFDAALADERIHAVQHLTFFVTAALFWWTLVHGRYGRAGYGVGVVFVFFTLIHSGLLAAMLSFADHPLYAHGARSAAWGVDGLVDQERAGLVMWVPASIIMMGIALALLAAWLGGAERRARLLEGSCAVPPS